MEFRARLTLRTELEAAVHDLSVDLRDFDADLAVVFASHHYGPEFVELIRSLYDKINTRNLIGCTGESIIGPTAEIEGRPSITVWAARLPDVRIFPFVIDQEDLEGMTEASAWYDRLGTTPDESPSFVVLPEPFSINVDACLNRIDAFFPGCTVAGGIASGANGPGQNRLFANDQALRQGMVGVALSGNVDISSVVSQGCRPVGKPFVITKATENLVEELGGRPALQVLREVYEQAKPADRKLMESGMHVGRLVDEHVEDYGPGDFVIRNMMGVYQNRALAIGDFLRPGQTVQFHVRDAEIADADFQSLLESNSQQYSGSPMGALLFSCNGRGRSFFKQANHDIGLVNAWNESCATAGFFAQGEIGPVGGKTFIHGFTSSLLVFREPQS